MSLSESLGHTPRGIMESLRSNGLRATAGAARVANGLLAGGTKWLLAIGSSFLNTMLQVRRACGEAGRGEARRGEERRGRRRASVA